MNSNSKESQPLYPSISPPAEEVTNPFHQTIAQEKQPADTNPFHQTIEQEKLPKMQSEAAAAAASSSSAHPPLPPDQDPEKWGTHIMGAPAVPTCHPDNKKAALWGAGRDEAQYHHHPYLQYSPIEKPSNSPMESILHVFNSWSHKAETMANNIWHNLRTGSSVSGAAWGKMNLTAKAISGGGFESLYKQTFGTYPDEKLKKTFACYLATSTGPVAGTLYLSNFHVAFCSDRPLSFTAPSGQMTWSYYKVMVPLSRVSVINPVVMREKENPSERYIQIITVDGHDFWYMGFVNFDKATKHLSESLSSFVSSVASGVPVPPAPAPAPAPAPYK